MDEFQIFYQSPRTYPPPMTLSVQIAFCNDSARATYAFQFNPTDVGSSGHVPRSPDLSSFPQPVSNTAALLHLQLNVDAADIGKPATIWMSDILGRRITTPLTSTAQSAETLMSIPLPPVPKGLYLCHASIGTTAVTHVIIVSE